MDLTDNDRAFVTEHQWAVLGTGRRDGSPQQSMVTYVLDAEDRFVVSTKSYTAKWHNVTRRPLVSLLIPDGRRCVTVYGAAEGIGADPERAELTADVFARLSGGERPDPTTLVGMLDEQRRTVLRITPTRWLSHE